MRAQTVTEGRRQIKHLTPGPLFLRSFVIGIVLLLFGLNQAWAQSTLWRSHSHGKTLYIMGSIHVLKKEHYPLAPAMEKAFQESDLIVFEIDQQEMESAASQQLFMTKGLYQKGASLEQNIAPSTFRALTKQVASLKLPIALFQPMKPAYCALIITMMEFQRLGFEAKYGIDLYFDNKARQQGKKRAALESAEFQINLFFNLDAKDQEKFLKQTLLEIDTFSRESERMGKAWQNGEGEKLHEILSTSFDDFPDLYEKLLIRRNKMWLPKIEDFSVHNQTVLVVVGAGHLVGPHSIIKLLEQRGFTFNQL